MDEPSAHRARGVLALTAMLMVLAPGAAGNLSLGGAPSGATYVSDAHGVIRIRNNSTADQAALLAAGCTPLTSVPGEPGERITVSASPYQLPGDGSIYFDITNATGAALILLLPLSPAIGQECVVTDEGGNAGTWNWAIRNGANAIDTIALNGGWSKLRWNGANWLKTG